MDQFAKERDRLLERTARLVGLVGIGVTAICLSLPGVSSPDILIVTLVLCGLTAGALWKIGTSRSLVWVVPGALTGLGALVVAQIPSSDATAEAVATSLVPLAGAGIAAFALVLTNSLARLGVAGLLLVASAILTETAVPGDQPLSSQTATVLLGWALIVTLAYWLNASVPKAARKIFSIGRAHRAERLASETEAQRRQSARLLHDTVLATLTLLAHSGVGVSPDALRHQAGDDARLLRQLRLGGAPVPQSSEHYNLEPVEESALGHTLESVKQRFGRMGLEVSWHGTGQVLLPSDVLDAFLLALAECLENVRRHSGVTDAHVTITDDDTTVRAMVTDAGVGFNLDDIDSARLGFKDSVVGRLHEVGGRARLFSSPGSGTTVVLEVPR
ncbi:sensor histidine kinase [Marisediminicola sp. LYQ134]|uniref:sensor histidine kinase n=1 Tax=Marisediminicola sp. LYQ134 TaxID=3391061 RepID=UPI003983685B